MPKQKVHKGLKKRVKVTGSGKVRRHRSGKSHLMSSKNAKRLRRLRKPTLVAGKKADVCKEMLCV